VNTVFTFVGDFSVYNDVACMKYMNKDHGSSPSFNLGYDSFKLLYHRYRFKVHW